MGDDLETQAEPEGLAWSDRGVLAEQGDSHALRVHAGSAQDRQGGENHQDTDQAAEKISHG